MSNTTLERLKTRLAELEYQAQAFALSGLELPEDVVREGRELQAEIARLTAAG